ncbi:hypothetical protein B0H12DRAFT_691238 [Mycena haematopus]|nr:hypothetical protein B0H12DRAFT_691238 [Mycena haematopus]
MTSSMFRLLFCCVRRPVETDPTVIPTETTHLISAVGFPSPGLTETLAVDPQLQHLQDRMGTIVRSTEAKMVNVSARAPFILQSTPGGIAGSPPSAARSSSSPTSSVHPPTAPTVGRRPPVFTLTPACARLQSRYSSPGVSRQVSRSSSCRRADFGSSDRYTVYAYSSVERGRQVPSKWFSETETESESSVSVHDESAGRLGIAHPISRGGNEADTDVQNTMSIAFSWGDV